MILTQRPNCGDDGLGGAIGRLDPSSDAFEKAHAKPAFELANLDADRRLAEVQAPCRGRKAARVDNCGKRSELVEVNAAHRSSL